MLNYYIKAMIDCYIQSKFDPSNKKYYYDFVYFAQAAVETCCNSLSGEDENRFIRLFGDERSSKYVVH